MKQFPNYNFRGKHCVLSSIEKKRLKKYKSFCVVRNPFDRIVSQWLWGYKKLYKIGFKEFIRVVDAGDCEKHFRRHKRYWYIPQIKWITDEAGKIIVDKILRYENLQHDFGNMCIDWQLPTFNIFPDINTSESHCGFARKSWREYYNKKTMGRVRKLYSEDFKAFGYNDDSDNILHKQP